MAESAALLMAVAMEETEAERAARAAMATKAVATVAQTVEAEVALMVEEMEGWVEMGEQEEEAHKAPSRLQTADCGPCNLAHPTPQTSRPPRHLVDGKRTSRPCSPAPRSATEDPLDCRPACREPST